MRLGDFFSQDFRDNLADNWLKVGAILHFFNNQTNPPKNKIVVVVGFDGTKALLAYVFINSNINPNLFSTQELRNLHIPISATNRSYLSHNSYINCAEIKEDEVEVIRQKIAGNANVYKGDLSNDEYEEIKRRIISSGLISDADKEKFGFSDPPNSPSTQ